MGTGRGTPSGAYGGRAAGGDGYWHATSPYGTTAYGGYNRYYGGAYSTYHPPTVVNTYYGGGCWGCGGWGAAGAAAAGLGVGAAMGAAAESNAYAAAAAPGAIYPTLPAGCIYRPLPAAYECGGYLAAARPTARTASTTAAFLRPDHSIVRTRADRRPMR